jgi:pantetheine-phosphate adenylyltransferase
MTDQMRNRSVAIFPASFDPPTNGHLDIVRRAIEIVDQLFVGVAYNTAKEGTFSKTERVEMLESIFGSEPRVKVASFEQLTVDFAKQIGASVIIRGLRAMSDFEYEFEMELMNKRLSPEIETVFLMAGQEYLYISSSRLKELVRLGQSVEEFVPPVVAKKLNERLGRG